MLVRWFAMHQSRLLFVLLPAQAWVSCHWKWSLLWEISAWAGFGQVLEADLRNTSAEAAVSPDFLLEAEPTLWVLRRFACENGRAVNVRCFLAAIDIVAQKTPRFRICWLFLLGVIVRYFTDPRVSSWLSHLLDRILGLFLVAWVPVSDRFDIVKFGAVTASVWAFNIVTSLCHPIFPSVRRLKARRTNVGIFLGFWTHFSLLDSFVFRKILLKRIVHEPSLRHGLLDWVLIL